LLTSPAISSLTNGYTRLAAWPILGAGDATVRIWESLVALDHAQPVIEVEKGGRAVNDLVISPAKNLLSARLYAPPVYLVG
jgi:hypothetical protein